MPDGTDGTDGAGVVACKRCGEAEGTGLACALCAMVRVVRNTPPRDPVEEQLAEARRAAADTDRSKFKVQGSKFEEKKETTMRLPMRKPSEPLPPLRRATEEPPGPRPVGRPRGTGHRPEAKCPDCGARVSGPWRCRKCSGLARRGKKIRGRGLAGPPPADLEPGPHADERRAAEGRGSMIEVPREPIPPGGVAVRGPAGKPARPAGMPAADAPGPLTLAVCNFFGEVARASDHIEARMVLDRRKLSITVELALPENAEPGARNAE